MDKFRKRLGVTRITPQYVQSVSSFGYTSDFSGRLGNHMFIYAYVRLLAETEGRPWRLYSDLLGRFNVPNESAIKTTIYSRPAGTEWYQEDENSFLLSKYRHVIKNWFKPSDNGKEILNKHNNPIVLHIRGSDFIWYKWEISKEYYRHILSKEDNVIVVTDDQEYCKSFIRSIPIIHSDYDFSILYHAKNLISSNSTYCWWAAFLGEHDSVRCPVGQCDNDKSGTKLMKFGVKYLGWKIYG